MTALLFICAGGFFGAIARFVVFRYVSIKERATFIVNVSGSFVIGAAMQLITAEWLYFFFVLGFLGAYTTFSTFTLDVVQLYATSKRSAYMYAARTVLYSLLAVLVGYYIV